MKNIKEVTIKTKNGKASFLVSKSYKNKNKKEYIERTMMLDFLDWGFYNGYLSWTNLVKKDRSFNVLFDVFLENKPSKEEIQKIIMINIANNYEREKINKLINTIKH